MKTLILQNVTREGPGLIGDVLCQRNMPYDLVDLDRGGKIPSAAGYDFLVVLGGPDSANDATEKIRRELEFIREWLRSGRPYLGVCLGMQLLVKAAGGQVVRAERKETGFFDPEGNRYEIRLTAPGRSDPLFDGLAEEIPVFQLHGETVRDTPGMTLLGAGEGCLHQVVRFGPAAYGIQCHLEVTEELLGIWAGEDGDLLPLDRGKLLAAYRAMEPSYTANGLRMINNFFSLSQAAAGGKR